MYYSGYAAEKAARMATVDACTRWTCTNTECDNFDQWLWATVVQNIMYRNRGVPPHCSGCSKDLVFIERIC